MDIAEKSRIRNRFIKENEGRKVLCGNATDFKGEYVEWLEGLVNVSDKEIDRLNKQITNRDNIINNLKK